MTDQDYSPEDTAHLARLIHNGPLEARPMTQFVKALRHALKASFVGLTLQQPVLVRPLMLHVQDAEFDRERFMESYLNRFSHEDPFPYLLLEPNRIYSASEMFGQQWKEGAYYRQFLQPYGLDEILFVRLEIPDALNAYLFVIRSEGQPPFCARDVALIEHLLPDLGQACQVSSHIRRLEAERQIYEDAVEAMGIGTLLIDTEGKIIHADLLARTLLTDQDTLVLRESRLTCKRPEQREQLGELINRALADRTGDFSSALLVPSSSGDELLLLVRSVSYPLSVSSEPGPRVALFLSKRTGQPMLRPDVVCELFGLSAAEADLAIKLAEGASLTEAAELLHISEHTARTYSKRIYSKTGTNRQAELVQLILTSVARVGGRPNNES